MRSHFNDAAVILILMFMATTTAAPHFPSLGLSEQALEWMALVTVPLGVLLNRLQTVGQEPRPTAGGDPAKPPDAPKGDEGK